MKKVKYAALAIMEAFALILLNGLVWILDRIQRFRDWTKKPLDHTYMRLAFVYIAGLTLLGVGWWIGFLGPIVVSAGWVGKVVGGLVVCHIGLAFYILRTNAMAKPYLVISEIEDFEPEDAQKLIKLRSDYRRSEGLVEWLNKIDSSILGVGFLGKLYGIAKILESTVGTTDMAAGQKLISHGVSIALFSTIMGLGLSLWTHCGTIVVSNRLNSLRE